MGTMTIDDHAVVLGGSMAGLLAARVLTESYRRVTVVERDLLPSAAAHRRGVPQGRHVHALRPRGRELIEQLFEGFTNEMVAAAAEIGDELAQARLEVIAHLKQGDLEAQVLIEALCRLLGSNTVSQWIRHSTRHTSARLPRLSPDRAGETDALNAYSSFHRLQWTAVCIRHQHNDVRRMM